MTAFGFSSGAFAIANLMVAKDGSLNLFDRAVMHSGTILPFVESTNTFKPVVQYLANITNCNTPDMIQCLTDLSAEKLMAASHQTNTIMNFYLSTIWGPVIDGVYLQRQQHVSLQLGLVRKIPLLITTNLDEAQFFVPIQGFSAQEMLDFRDRLFPSLIGNFTELERLYPSKNESHLGHNISSASTDFLFQCPARLTAKTFSNFGVPVFRTMFNYSSWAAKTAFGSTSAMHGVDLLFWWQTHFLMTLDEIQLSKLMLHGLIDFATCTNIVDCRIGEQENVSAWHIYSNVTTPTRGYKTVFTLPITEISTQFDDEWDQKCAFFDELVASRGTEFVTVRFPSAQILADSSRSWLYPESTINDFLVRKAYGLLHRFT